MTKPIPSKIHQRIAAPQLPTLFKHVSILSYTVKVDEAVASERG